jgi:hypothetical protein
MPSLKVLKALVQCAASGALAMAPALGEAGPRERGQARVSICAGSERKVIFMDLGGSGPAEHERGHSACHAACLSNRKTPAGARR